MLFRPRGGRLMRVTVEPTALRSGGDLQHDRLLEPDHLALSPALQARPHELALQPRRFLLPPRPGSRRFGLRHFSSVTAAWTAGHSRRNARPRESTDRGRKKP